MRWEGIDTYWADLNTLGSKQSPGRRRQPNPYTCRLTSTWALCYICAHAHKCKYTHQLINIFHMVYLFFFFLQQEFHSLFVINLTYFPPRQNTAFCLFVCLFVFVLNYSHPRNSDITKRAGKDGWEAVVILWKRLQLSLDSFMSYWAAEGLFRGAWWKQKLWSIWHYHKVYFLLLPTLNLHIIICDCQFLLYCLYLFLFIKCGKKYNHNEQDKRLSIKNKNSSPMLPYTSCIPTKCMMILLTTVESLKDPFRYIGNCFPNL